MMNSVIAVIWSFGNGMYKRIDNLNPFIRMIVNWVSIDSGNGLSPLRHQAIIWKNAAVLSIEPLATNFIEIWI